MVKAAGRLLQLALQISALYLLTTVPYSYAQTPARVIDNLMRPDGTSQDGRALDSQYCAAGEYSADQLCLPAENYYSDYTASGADRSLQTPVANPYSVLPLGGSGQYTRPDVFTGNDIQRPRATQPTHFEREPPTEFQRYVASAVGQIVPIYGASLFERVPDTFAPIDRVPVSSNYLIAPGDELQITVWGRVNFSRRSVVDRTGEIVLPEVGPIAVAGLTYAQAVASLKSAMAHLYKDFDVSVTLGRLHSIQIFVVGEARRPGTYTVSSLSTVVNAVFACGGPSAHGSMRHIELRRGNKLVSDFDLYDLLIHGDKSSDTQLEPGDVIMIPPVGARVAVVGSIERPSIYELKGRTTVDEVVRLSAGLSPVAASQEALVQRVGANSTLGVARVLLDAHGLQTPLENGDILRVLPLVPRFENAVTLRGNVADPTRLPWFAGMRLSDLIPNKESLLTRDYWKQKNRITDELTGAGDRSYLPNDSAADDERRQTLRPAMANPMGTDSTSGSLFPASSAQLAYREQPRNLRGDASLGAATGVEGIVPIRTFLPQNSIQPNAPEINWEYASIERVDPASLNTQIIPFELGKLVLEHDPKYNVPLRPGDVVTIFSKADFSVPSSQQTRQVRIEGEVRRAGVYSVSPYETLREVLARAGGLTPSAYLYGLQFTRESTRREQQKRYDDFLNQFERQVNEAASNLSSRIISPQQAATAQTSVASQRDLVDRLRKVTMNGRIVLDLQPNSSGEKSLPDLPLENGDRLYIPSRPSTVNVIGTVAEQTSFLYQEDLRTGDYLKKAGGPARSADKSHMFIIRADGSVVSDNPRVVLFGKNFDGLPMYPGDTLIVPTFINKSTFLRDLMDWSQVFSNLALGAAAVNVLH